MKLISKKIIPLLFVLPLLSACYYDNLEELHPVIPSANSCDTTGTISYLNDVAPILSSSCGINNDCHSTATSTSGIALDNYADVRSYATTIVKSVKHDASLTQSQWMPSGGGMLSSCSINKIEAWVNRGRLNN